VYNDLYSSLAAKLVCFIRRFKCTINIKHCLTFQFILDLKLGLLPPLLSIVFITKDVLKKKVKTVGLRQT